MKRYNKAIDYALLAMHYARKAEMSKSASVKAAFRKKAVQAALNSGKQKDTLDGMKTLEASLRIAAENEGMLPPPVDDELDMEEDMPMEAEDDMMDDVDVDDVDMDIQEVDAEAEDDDDDDVEESEEDEDEEDDDEAVEAFNRVAARVRARRLAARKLQARKQLVARARARRLAARRAAR